MGRMGAFGRLVVALLSYMGGNAPTPLASFLSPDNYMTSPTPSSSEAGSCKLRKTDVNLSEGFGPTTDFVPSRGVLNGYMIFIDFPDAEATEAQSSLHDYFLPGAADWYTESSFGQLNLVVKAELSRFFRMPANSTSYDYQRGLTYEQHRVYIQDALDAVGTQVDFSGTDVLYIVPTKAAKEISYSPTFMGTIVAGDGTTITKTVTFGMDVYDTWGYKTLNHETGHAMGLPDLYAFEGTVQHRFVGGYDIMGYIAGTSPDFLAWHKWKLGWFSDNQFDCVSGSGSTEHTLTPIEENIGRKGVIIKQNETTAIVAEVRTQQRLDINATGNGILIYTVKTDVESGYGLIEIHNATPGESGLDENSHPLFTTEADRNTFSLPDMRAVIKVTAREENNYTIQVNVD